MNFFMFPTVLPGSQTKYGCLAVFLKSGLLVDMQPIRRRLKRGITGAGNSSVTRGCKCQFQTNTFFSKVDKSSDEVDTRRLSIQKQQRRTRRFSINSGQKESLPCIIAEIECAYEPVVLFFCILSKIKTGKRNLFPDTQFFMIPHTAYGETFNTGFFIRNRDQIRKERWDVFY